MEITQLLRAELSSEKPGKFGLWRHKIRRRHKRRHHCDVREFGKVELDTPTMARVMPIQIKRWNGFLATNASSVEAKLA